MYVVAICRPAPPYSLCACFYYIDRLEKWHQVLLLQQDYVHVCSKHGIVLFTS